MFSSCQHVIKPTTLSKWTAVSFSSNSKLSSMCEGLIRCGRMKGIVSIHFSTTRRSLIFIHYILLIRQFFCRLFKIPTGFLKRMYNLSAVLLLSGWIVWLKSSRQVFLGHLLLSSAFCQRGKTPISMVIWITTISSTYMFHIVKVLLISLTLI